MIYSPKYHFLLHILRFLFIFSDNIMADVASKQQTTASFLSIIVTRTRRHTELTKKLTNLMGNLCYAREHSVQFFVQIFYTVNLHSLNQSVLGPEDMSRQIYFTTSTAVTNLHTGQPKILSAGARGISPKCPEGLLGPTSHPLKGGGELREVCSPSPGLKQLCREDYSPLSSVQLKSKWSCASVTLYAFMACPRKYLASIHNT